MDGLQSYNAQFPLGNSAPGHLPGNAALDYPGWVHQACKPAGHNSEAFEISILRSKLAAADCRLVELQKDKEAAQTVNDLILRSVTRAGLNRSSTCSCLAVDLPYFADAVRTGRDIQDILMAILGVMRETSNVGRTEHNRSLDAGLRTNATNGNLLDLDDEQPSSKALVHGEGGLLDHLGAASEADRNVNQTEITRETGTTDSSEQAEDLLTFKADDLLPIPYLTRFESPRNQASTTSDKTLQRYSESDDRTLLSECYAENGSSGGNVVLASTILDKDDGHGIQIPAGVETRPFENSSNAVGVPQPDTATLFEPQWPTQTIMISPGERALALQLRSREVKESERRLPGYFDHGIRFRPGDSVTKQFRTVLVDNLPRSLTASTLMMQVRGGAVMDAKLVDTTNIHGCLSALITFVHEHGAKAFERQARQQHLIFDGVEARVVLLPTPTWPMPKHLFSAIFENSRTRCLEVHNFPRSIRPAEFLADLRACRALVTHGIEAKKMRSDNVLELRCMSVKYAEQAYGILTHHNNYRQCRVKNMPDPCVQPRVNSSIGSVVSLDAAPHIKEMPVKEASDVANLAAVSHWKEYAHKLYTKVPSLDQPHTTDSEPSDDRTGRLGNTNVDEATPIQRGRGFSSKEPVNKAADTCSPQ
ncbi:MAG: hypothetical protein Q9166_003372 [cf. Caloplaca sp. 2 TL-2023]